MKMSELKRLIRKEVMAPRAINERAGDGALDALQAAMFAFIDAGGDKQELHDEVTGFIDSLDHDNIAAPTFDQAYLDAGAHSTGGQMTQPMMTERQLRQLIRAQIIEGFKRKKARRLSEQGVPVTTGAADKKGKPLAAGAEALDVNYDGKSLAAALGPGEVDTAALTTAMKNAKDKKLTTKDRLVLSDTFIDMINSPNKAKAFTALAAIKIPKP